MQASHEPPEKELPRLYRSQLVSRVIAWALLPLDAVVFAFLTGVGTPLKWASFTELPVAVVDSIMFKTTISPTRTALNEWKVVPLYVVLDASRIERDTDYQADNRQSANFV